MADRRLQVFYAVAKELSFTKAAESLFMTQPAVTFQIKQLEEYFNTRLFERGHGKISLTPAGRVVRDYAEKIMGLSAELDTRLAEMTGEIRGPLLVGASNTIADLMLPRILGEFVGQHSTVKPQLTIGNSETIEARVAEHSLDIGLIEATGHSQNLEVELCGDEELKVICSPDSFLAQCREIPPRQLLEYPYISRESGSGIQEFIVDYFEGEGLQPEKLSCIMELGSSETIKAAVETGVGFAILPSSAVVKECALGRLVAVSLNPRLMYSLSMVFPKERFRSRLVNAFVDFAKGRFKQLNSPVCS